MPYPKNKKTVRGALFLTATAILVACGGPVKEKEEDINNYSVISSERMTFATDERQEHERNKQQEHEPRRPEEFSSERKTVPAEQNLSRREVLRALNAQHREWRRVRYQIGGMSKDGIDCSRFVFITFQRHFNLDLPKNTEAQLAAGLAITRRDLEAGDLVFFKTGWRTNHVGIYLKDSLFLHASATRGVTISRLDNRYWAQRYWRSLRVLRSAEQLSDSRYRERPESLHLR